MHKFTHRKGLLALGAVLLLTITGGAYAYWTGAGSGSASGQVGTGGELILTGTFEGDAPAPGTSTTISFTAENATTSAIRLGTISLAGVTVDAGHAACSTADFTMADINQNRNVPANTPADPQPNDGTLAYADTGVNQDACKGATLTLALTSN